MRKAADHVQGRVVSQQLAMAVNGQALALYRRFLRAAAAMPTSHRQEYVSKAARAGFEKHRQLVDAAAVQRELQLGLVMLDQAEAHAEHLSSCKARGLLDAELVDSHRNAARKQPA